MERLADSTEQPLERPEPFDWKQPEDWTETEDLEVLAEQMLNDPKIEAALWLIYNSEKAAKLHDWPDASHTVPAAEHYRHTYLWDTGFIVIMLSQAALFTAKAAAFLESKNDAGIADQIAKLQEYSEMFTRKSHQDSFWVVNKQKPNGFIAGTQYAPGWEWYEIEKFLSLDRKDKSTNYTQPPILPLGVMAAYKAMKESGHRDSDNYLQGMYGYMDKFMQFFQTDRREIDKSIPPTAKDRRNKDNPLIGVVDPHETGQDSATRWDHHKPERQPRRGFDTPPEVDEDNRYMDGALAVLRQIDRFVWARNNPDRIRKLFWENDVSMNAMYYHNLEVMVWLSEEMAEQTGLDIYKQRSREYQGLAEELQAAIKDRMWFTSQRVPQKGFYNIKSSGEPNPDISPNNIFALVIPDLSEEQLEAVLDMLDEHFDVEYSLPSASIKNPEYDPDNREADRLWRGPTWININYYIVEFGLIKHSERPDVNKHLRERCRQWALRITQASNDLLNTNHTPGLRAEEALALLAVASGPEEVKQLEHITGAYEHFHPHKATGQRPRVRNFAWSWLARFMTYSR